MRPILFSLVVLACASMDARAESTAKERCKAVADAIAPLVPQIDALTEAIGKVDTSGLSGAHDGLMRGTVETEERRRRAAERALDQYGHALWALYNRLRNCEMAGTQAFQ